MSSDSDWTSGKPTGEDIWRETDDAEKIKGMFLGAGIFTLFGGFVGLFASDPVSGFFGGIFVFGIISAAFVIAILNEDSGFGNQQQQQVGGRSEPTVVCSQCGWENPKSNNYCHDCGSQLNKEGKDG